MSKVVKGARGPGCVRAAVNLTLSCVLLGGCSSGTDRFSSFSFGSGFGGDTVNEAAASSNRVAANTPQPVQSRPASYQSQPASGYQLASASPSQSGGYLQVSRVDLPPLPQSQAPQRTKLADGYGPYNQPPLPDGTYSGPRVYTPYDGPRGDGPPPATYTPDNGERYGREAPPPPSYYGRADPPPPPAAYGSRDDARSYEPRPDGAYGGERTYGGDGRYGYIKPEPGSYTPQRPWNRGTEGETVEVVRGDTLYTLARRYGVTVDMIARANGLSTVHVRPGTKLFIPRADPASYAAHTPPHITPRSAIAARKDQSRQAVASAERPERQYREGAPAGQELRAPSSRLANKDVRPGLLPPAAAQTAPEVRSAELTPMAEPSCEAALSNPQPRMGSTFRRPVDGKTIAQFGPQKDGTVNEGITISVPKGTPVKAAENGVVAYVGDELPGFGNLILIRHADDYVTAYAHADTVFVKKCDVVKRGQTLATAGTSGDASQPELHFEIRKNSKPVDPLPLLGS